MSESMQQTSWWQIKIIANCNNGYDEIKILDIEMKKVTYFR